MIVTVMDKELVLHLNGVKGMPGLQSQSQNLQSHHLKTVKILFMNIMSLLIKEALINVIMIVTVMDEGLVLHLNGVKGRQGLQNQNLSLSQRLQNLHQKTVRALAINIMSPSIKEALIGVIMTVNVMGGGSVLHGNGAKGKQDLQSLSQNLAVYLQGITIMKRKIDEVQIDAITIANVMGLEGAVPMVGVLENRDNFTKAKKI